MAVGRTDCFRLPARRGYGKITNIPETAAEGRCARRQPQSIQGIARGEEMQYRLIRSNRKSISIEVRPEGLLVRAPMAATQAQIDDLLRRKADWISEAQRKLAARTPVAPESRLSMDEIQALADRALQYIPARVAHYAPLVGVTYGRITIRNQKSRWGSCSSKGNLNFNCLLMLTPPQVIDSVVVHELCHRKEMNHSDRFYREVLRVFPDYWKWDKWLKENGPALIRRMTASTGEI